MTQINKELQELIEKEIDAGYISKNKHPDVDLWVLNYTKSCQYAWRWNEATVLCRGLIVDNEYNVVAKSYPKFFSIDQIDDVKTLPLGQPARVYEKVDGSLGVVYFIDNVPYVASRGSFLSDMAVKGTEMLRTIYKDVKWDSQYSYVVEIIYPENRIVIDYGTDEKMVLHGVYNNCTGEEIPLHEFKDISSLRDAGVPIIKEFEVCSSLTDFDRLVKDYPYDGGEGFVVRFQDGYRLKLKYNEYKKLAYLMDMTSNKKLLDMIELGSIKDIIDSLPVDIYNRVTHFVKVIHDSVYDVKNKHSKKYEQIQFGLCKENTIDDKRRWAEEILKAKDEGYSDTILFAYMNKKLNVVNREAFKIIRKLTLNKEPD